MIPSLIYDTALTILPEKSMVIPTTGEKSGEVLLEGKLASE